MQRKRKKKFCGKYFWNIFPLLKLIMVKWMQYSICYEISKVSSSWCTRPVTILILFYFIFHSFNIFQFKNRKLILFKQKLINFHEHTHTHTHKHELTTILSYSLTIHRGFYALLLLLNFIMVVFNFRNESSTSVFKWIVWI